LAKPCIEQRTKRGAKRAGEASNRKAAGTNQNFESKKMTLDEIKTAVDQGLKVNQHHAGYEVIRSKFGEYLIHWVGSEWYIGLTWQDGQTMNGKEEEFFIG